MFESVLSLAFPLGISGIFSLKGHCSDTNVTSPFIVIAASATLVMKVLDYNALKLILVLNRAMEAAIMKLSALRPGLAVTTVHVMLVSVVMVLCVSQ